jgi:putative RNA 2'-phosphotransferase
MSAEMSRKMSYGLRHRPEVFGITSEQLKQGWNGFVPISMVLKSLKIDKATLRAVVAEDSKGRFEIQGDFIRACQGHSVPVDLGLQTRTPPDVLFHGTTARAWQNIKTEGLKKGSRHAVHLSSAVETATQVGNRHVKRNNKLMILIVDAKAMTKQGFAFQVSTNGVWLTERVPAGFLSVWEGTTT